MRKSKSISLKHFTNTQLVSKISSRKFISVVFLCLFLSITANGAPKKASRENELIKEFMGADKKFLVTQNMDLNIIDQRLFMPIYEKYEKERADLIDKRIALLEKFIANATETSDAELDLIHSQSQSVAKKLMETQGIVFENIRQVLGMNAAMRFIKIDDHITHSITLNIFNKIPLKGATTKEERNKLNEDQPKTIDTTTINIMK